MSINDPSATPETCILFPPKINSEGINSEGYSTLDGALQYRMPQLELQIVVIFFFTHACRYLLKPLGLPAFVSQLLAGILLGPLVLGKELRVKQALLPTGEMGLQSQQILDATSLFGYTFFLFLTGVKMDMGMLWKVGRKSWTIGVLATMVPVIVSFSTLGALGGSGKVRPDDSKELSIITLTQSLTSFPVISCLLNDLEIQNSELGRLALSSSLVSNLVGVSLVMASSFLEMDPKTIFTNITLTIVFLLVVRYILRPAMLWVIQQTPEGRTVKDAYLHAILVVLLLCSLASKYFDQSVLFGALFLGLAVPDGPPLGSAIVNKLDCFFMGILLPLYVAVSAAKVDLRELINALQEGENMRWEWLLIFVVLVSKFLGCIAAPLYCKMPVNDSVALALILCCKGVVELCTYQYVHEQKMFSDHRMGLALIVVLVTAAVVPILVKRLFNSSRKYAGYQKRNVIHLKLESVLPVLVCINRPDHVNPVIDLIDACYPTQGSPMVVFILHLIELVGRATPIFISHQLQRKVANGKSYSDNVVLSFTQYARNNPGAVHVNIFTAVSPPKLMHEDICYTALDKLACLIILPFHRRWSPIDGSFELEDNHVRTLNNSVLQRAPCSVGILVDRGHLGARGEEVFRVGMFFLGGSDDREALSLAKRMARDSSVRLTVVQLSVGEGGGVISWDTMIDEEVLRDIKSKPMGDNVEYMKAMVEDGPKTAKLVRSMVHEFDLVMVGRRDGVECSQTMGLSEWMEVPELGILGDLLASTDLDTKTSLLVLQQQRMLQ